MDSISLSSEYASSTTITLAITLLVARSYGGEDGCNDSAKDAPPSTVGHANMTPPDTVDGRSIAPFWRRAVPARVTRAADWPRTGSRCRDVWAEWHMMWP